MRSRTVERVALEYEQKWGHLLTQHQHDPSLTVEQLHALQFRLEETCQQTRAMVRMALMPYADQTLSVVELGCGWGFALSYAIEALPTQHPIGGELTESGRTLAQRINPTATIVPFDFYDASTYQFLEHTLSPIIIYTHHAIEQLPSCVPFMENLRPYQDRLHAIVHMEPLYDYYNTTPAGKRQRHYLELNHYNRDLLERVESQGDILRFDRQVMAANPINPTSLLVWRFHHA